MFFPPALRPSGPPAPNHLPTFQKHISTPIDLLRIKSSNKGITEICFVKSKKGVECENEHIDKCTLELAQYFKGELKKFTVTLDVKGTEFQKKVWKELQKIPFGKTVSYGFVAGKINNPKASRAVGGANNKNKISIIIPCHRVVGSDGKLVGYAGGVWRKKRLLEIEQK